MVPAQVAVACGGATTTEDADRATLKLDNHEFLDDFVRFSPIPTVLVALAPGAVVLPEADAATAVVALFLGGEATGEALADVLSGAEPGGRLPVTLPLSENDVIEPCDDVYCPYDEQLLTGYRGGAPARFVFGHGLSYASFELVLANSTVDDAAATLEIVARHVAGPAGTVVVQLYAIKDGTDERGRSGRNAPLMQLKAFEKRELAPGAEARISFRLTFAGDLRTCSCRADLPLMNRGGAAAATSWISSFDESRRRRGRDVVDLFL